ncbi:MAG: ABC transporter permease [Flavobacteriales bacterium]|nr:MAG: ABC transporter permease [Flavobacteriales bacterium]
MNFPHYIAKRYLFTKSSNNAINIITFIAALGVVVGTIALFIVLSVFSGLKEFSLSFINMADPDLKITAAQGKSFFFTDSLENVLNQKDIAVYSKVVEEKAFFNYKNKSTVANIKGVDTNYLSINPIDSVIYDGNWLDFDAPTTAVVGNNISAQLSMGVYDVINPLKVYVPKPGKGYINNPKNAFNQINIQPVGVFRLTEEIDKKYVFVPLETIQKLLKYKPNELSSLELKLVEGAKPKEVAKSLRVALGNGFAVKTRMQLNALYYKMINTENFVSYLIFTLILIIAMFNIVGAIIMMILDKRENLYTLFSLGTNLKEIKKIFVYQGFLLTFYSLVFGLIIAVTIVLLQKFYGFIMITPSLPYPVKFTYSNMSVVIVTILLLGYIAALIASSRISKKLIER